MARPSEYTEDMAIRICEQIALGRSLNSICAGDDFPSVGGVYKWLSRYPAFVEMYTRAREDQADTLADQIVEIADERETVVKEMDGGTTAVVFDSTAVARNRLRVDARKWVAAKLKPRKYGERQTIEHAGTIRVAEELSDEDLARVAAGAE